MKATTIFKFKVLGDENYFQLKEPNVQETVQNFNPALIGSIKLQFS